MSENKNVIAQRVVMGSIRCEDDDTLTPQVRRLLEKGWQPVGPSMCTGMPRFDFFQTMVRYEEADE